MAGISVEYPHKPKPIDLRTFMCYNNRTIESRISGHRVTTTTTKTRSIT